MSLLGGLFGGLLGGNKNGGGLLGTVGGAVKGAVGLLPSIIGTAVGAAKTKKAMQMSPGLYNPLQVDLLQEIQSKKKALETGTAYAPMQRQLNQSSLQALRTAGNLAGGDIGMMMGALKGINRQAGVNQNALLGQMSQEGVNMTNLMNNLTQQMANRQLQVSMADKNQRLAMAQQTLKDSMQGLRTGLSLGLDQLGRGNRGTPGVGVSTNVASLPSVSTPSASSAITSSYMTPAYTGPTLPKTQTGDVISDMYGWNSPIPTYNQPYSPVIQGKLLSPQTNGLSQPPVGTGISQNVLPNYTSNYYGVQGNYQIGNQYAPGYELNLPPMNIY